MNAIDLENSELPRLESNYSLLRAFHLRLGLHEALPEPENHLVTPN